MTSISGTGLFWIHVAMLLVSLTFTGLRVYVRAFMNRAMCADDWVHVIAMALFAASLSISMRGAVAGAFDQTQAKMSTAHHIASLKGAYFCEVLYPPVSLAIRVSVCLFLLQIVNKRLHRHILYMLLALVSVASLGYLFITAFQCVPPWHFWNQINEPGNGSCLDQQTLAIAGLVHGTVSAFSACVVGVLPVFVLWKIQVNARTKVTVIALLGMSIFACVAVVVRMATLTRHKTLSPHFFQSVMTTALWSMIEPGVGIVAASLPTLRPLFRKLGSSGSGAKGAPIQHPGGIDDRLRAPAMRQRWFHFTTNDTPDLEAGRPETTTKQSASAKCRDAALWSTRVEQGDFLELPPPVGIAVRTSIEVTISSRDSNSSGIWCSFGLDI
ncbi:hypothetical protein G6O67_001637 [Ophiocordyceps sinensis]|uniref:Rhodopsin domain-containing protein n=1 Tax=Ophiocordyceps sinensis TaxID=72228 RepID=A0A8H4PY34_9HYPO|nr:hypothetical protein G6O67_001637 [Ophiocordyceps sinensis]